MRTLGLVLFLIGIVLALISASKLPVYDTNWSDMLPLYCLAMLLAFVGLLLYHQSQSLNNLTYNSSTILCSSIVKLLQELMIEMNKLEADIFQLDEAELAQRVNFLLNQYVLPCNAARQEIIESLGHYKGSEVLISIAQGERLLNRVWSAASDGKIQEIYLIYPQIQHNFEEAYLKCINCQTNLLIFQQK